MRKECSLPRYCAGLGHRFLSKRRALDNSRLHAVQDRQRKIRKGM